jgi:hypothetical protein
MTTLDEFFDLQEEDDQEIEIEEEDDEEDNRTWRHLAGYEMGNVTFMDTPVDGILLESTKKGIYFAFTLFNFYLLTVKRSPRYVKTYESM